MGKILGYLKERDYQTDEAIKYLASLSDKDQLTWMIRVCKTFKSKPSAQLPHIQLLKELFSQRVEHLTLQNEIIDDEIDWFTSTIFDKEIQEAIGRLEPLIGNPTKWNAFENQIYRAGQKLQSKGKLAKRKVNQEQLLNFWQEKFNQMKALEQVYTDLQNICKFLIHASQDENFDKAHESNDSHSISHSASIEKRTQKKLSTARLRINFVEKFYREKDINTYAEALNRANESAGETLYSSVESFQNARRNLRLRDNQKK